MMSFVDQRLTDQIMHASLLTSFFSNWREDKNHTKLQISFKSFEELKIAIFTYSCSTHSSLQRFSSLPFDPHNSSGRRSFKEFGIGDRSKIPFQQGTHEPHFCLRSYWQLIAGRAEIIIPQECGHWSLLILPWKVPPPMHILAALNGLNGLFNNKKKYKKKKQSWEVDIGGLSRESGRDKMGVVMNLFCSIYV